MNIRRIFVLKSWWGKIIGAVFGFLIGGPAGALLGILIGNFFDRGLAEHLSRPYSQYHSEKNPLVKEKFIYTVFSVMGHLAKADGRVSERELDFAKQLIKNLSLSHSQKIKAQQAFNEGKQPDFNLLKALLMFKAVVQDNKALLHLLITLEYQAAQIDEFSEKKFLAISQILHIFGFAPLYQQYQQSQQSQHSRYQSRYQSEYALGKNKNSSFSLREAYALLNIDPNANQHEVKRAYRRLMSRHHPDKLIAQGLPEDQIRKANELTQQIRKAYDQISASRGWN